MRDLIFRVYHGLYLIVSMVLVPMLATAAALGIPVAILFMIAAPVGCDTAHRGLIQSVSGHDFRINETYCVGFGSFIWVDVNMSRH